MDIFDIRGYANHRIHFGSSHFGSKQFWHHGLLIIPVTMGVEVQTTEPGDGVTFPKAGDKLLMHYVSKLASTGEEIDSSRKRGIPFRFQIGVGQVIKGWDEGLLKLSLGEKATLHVSSDYAYGIKGAIGSVPPNTDLIFDVELVSISPF